MNGLIEGIGIHRLSNGLVITGSFKHGQMRSSTTVPDYHDKYSGTVFPIKLPAVDSLDVVRKNSISSQS